VTNGFVQVGGTDGIFYHTVVMLTDPVSGQTVISEAAPGSGYGGVMRLIPGVNGPLTVSMGSYDPSNTVIITTQPVGTIPNSLSNVANNLDDYNQGVNNAQFSYQGTSTLGYNSNSYASSADTFLGFKPGPAPVYAPGFGTPLPPVTLPWPP
jgi:hypothetical protein